MRPIPDLQKNPLEFLKEQLFSFKAASAYLTSLSLLGMLEEGLKFGLSRLFHAALAYYEAFLAFVFTPIEFLFNRLFSILHLLFAWDLHLLGEWRHAFMVMGLYFIVDLRAGYIPRRFPWPATASTAGIGLLIASVFSIGGGYLGENISPIWAVLMPIFGFGVYELLKAPISASYIPISSYSWTGTFAYYSLLYGVGNLLLGGFSVLAYMTSPWASVPGAEVLILVFFLFLLAVRNLVVAWIKTFIVKVNARDRLMTFLTSGSVRVAINVLYTLLMLFGNVVINAYLSGWQRM